MAGRQRVQGRRRRPPVQGPAGPGQAAARSPTSRAHGKLVAPERRRGRRHSATPAATSSWPPARTRAALPGLEVDGERVITSEHALHARPRARRSAIVLGGGVIGVEFASAWKSFGADVTIVEALPRLVAAEDEDVSKAARAGVPQARHQLQGRQAVREGRAAPRTASRSTIAGRRDRRGRAAAGRGRPRPDHRRPRVRGAGRHAWTAASSSPTSGCAPTSPTSTRSATSCPACSSPTAASSRASSSPRRSPG